MGKKGVSISRKKVRTDIREMATGKNSTECYVGTFHSSLKINLNRKVFFP